MVQLRLLREDAWSDAARACPLDQANALESPLEARSRTNELIAAGASRSLSCN
jgi:hypothetical protein